MVRIPEKDKLCGYGKLQPGMEILATKWIALLGTSYLVKTYKRQLRQHFPTPFVNKAISLSAEAAVLPAVMTAVGLEIEAQSGSKVQAETEAQSGGKVQAETEAQAGVKVRTETEVRAAAKTRTGTGRIETGSQDVALYEVCEGGIYAALWKMAQESGVGLEIQLRQIPIRQETVEVCEFLNINPYQLLSGGCLLIGTYHAEDVLRRLEQVEIPAVRIGRATDGNDRVLLDEGQVRYLERPQPDSFFRGMTQLVQATGNRSEATSQRVK